MGKGRRRKKSKEVGGGTRKVGGKKMASVVWVGEETEGERLGIGRDYGVTAARSSTLAWRIPWAEEPGRLQSTGSQRVGHELAARRSKHGSEDRKENGKRIFKSVALITNSVLVHIAKYRKCDCSACCFFSFHFSLSFPFPLPPSFLPLLLFDSIPNWVMRALRFIPSVDRQWNSSGKLQVN